MVPHDTEPTSMLLVSVSCWGVSSHILYNKNKMYALLASDVANSGNISKNTMGISNYTQSMLLETVGCTALPKADACEFVQH